jgi:N-acetylmuramoyl-L-alanine amidase
MFALAIFLGACQPAALLSNTAGGMRESATTGGTAASAAAAGELADAGRVGEGATATVTARSLRVRSAPNETAEVVAGIKEGEQYSVLGLSGDGLWAELEIPQAPGGSGWVSINFVSVAGPITDAATSDAALTPVPTPQAGYAVIQPVSPRLRVRAEPNTEAEIVGYAFTGQSFPVVEMSADGQWVKISGVEGSENPNGGWVTADFVAVGE